MSDMDQVIAALNLEYGANRRYGYQIEGSPFSRLNAILEGVRRSEGGHIDELVARLKARHADAEAGRGFATMLTHLKLDLEFERAAVDAYSRFAREAEDPELKAMFRDLTASEAGHIKMFEGIIAEIEANTYPVVIYCPVCGWEMDYGANPPAGTVQRCAKCKQKIALNIVDGDFVPATV
ncbi:MAG TPA: ferritin-like domain-containing protein [Armatimonadota bacterium]|jgi:rubrerythrin